MAVLGSLWSDSCGISRDYRIILVISGRAVGSHIVTHSIGLCAVPLSSHMWMSRIYKETTSKVHKLLKNLGKRQKILEEHQMVYRSSVLESFKGRMNRFVKNRGVVKITESCRKTHRGINNQFSRLLTHMGTFVVCCRLINCMKAAVKGF